MLEPLQQGRIETTIPDELGEKGGNALHIYEQNEPKATDLRHVSLLTTDDGA